jgi:hypothetical protein
MSLQDLKNGMLKKLNTLRKSGQKFFVKDIRKVLTIKEGALTSGTSLL